MSDDELTPYADDPVVAALLAPATADELAGEDAALAMFRQEAPRRRRALRRVAVGGAGVVLGLALTGGAAAAYTENLPAPLQNAYHSALAPLGVPAPPRATPPRSHAQVRHPAPRAVHPQPPATHRPVRTATPPAPAPRRSAAPASPAPVTAASPRPSASPSPAPPPRLSVAVSRRVVPVHSTVALSGVLTRDGHPLSGRRVYAAELPAGSSTWQRVGSGRTGTDGSVSVTVPSLTSNVRLRLVTEQGTRSAQLAVSVLPKLAISTARSGAKRVATVTADGGRQGDTLVLLRRDGGSWTKVGTTRLDGSRQGRFTVPGPRASRVRYRVRINASGAHGASAAEFVVPAR